jgi:uncharacterized protein (UPF0332 family)
VTEENRRDAIAKELRHAKLARDAARLLVDASLYNDALSRLYYALFHTLVALLLTEGVEPRRHRRLPHLLGTHFPSLLGAADIALVTRAATYRDLADYERTWEATAEIVAEACVSVDSLIARVYQHLLDTGWTTRTE